ncbi:MAG: hypothetical protein AUG51_10665 [Acidobacteria bacterium 13_1_20CM_3_53_8]|nr:MAG: hypothetical protein AUG51_10665 [Acidobacteria bacterium 13_1_20CM_3_53_8]
MAKDPGLAADTCIYMEAVAGDGGAHNSNGVWWLSPDIKLTGPTSGLDKADPGQLNPVEVTCHRKAAGSNCVTPGGETITIQLWVGNPSLAMTPDNPASTFLVQSIGHDFPAEGASATQEFDWTPPDGLPADNPQSSGHKCLIARAYPDSLTPSAKKFFVPGDPHVAQHNICIVPCGGPGAAKRPGPCGFKVLTLNLNAEQIETVILRAAGDLNPSKFVRTVVLERLEKTQGFRRLATRPPRGFKFLLPDFPKAEVTDRTRPGCLAGLFGIGFRPSYEAKVELRPGQLISFTFLADLTGASFGDAYIFHLTQTGAADASAQGGLTIVMVSV